MQSSINVRTQSDIPEMVGRRLSSLNIKPIAVAHADFVLVSSMTFAVYADKRDSKI